MSRPGRLANRHVSGHRPTAVHRAVETNGQRGGENGPALGWRRLGWRRWWRAEEGRVSAFVVVLTAAVLALAGLALDGGLALAAKTRANGQAESAARAGADAIDLAIYRDTGQLVLVPAQAVARAQSYLA